MRSYPRITLVSVLAAGLLGGGLAVTQPAVADHTVDDVNCVNTHCVHAADLASGDLTNHVEDGGFERIPSAQLGNPKSWPTRTGTPIWTVHAVAADCYQGLRCARRSGNGTAGEALMANGAQVEVKPGEQLRATGFATSLTAANGTAGLRIQWIKADGSVTNGTQATLSSAAPGWRSLTFEATAPAAVVRARVALIATNTQGTWLADAIELRRIVSNAMLASNAVTSSKVADGNLQLSDLMLASIDSRYPTRTSLTGGTPNTPGNPVSWGRLYNMPAGFADGTDANNNLPRVFEATGQNSILCNDWCNHAFLTLPTGRWLVSAKADVWQEEADDDLFAACELGQRLTNEAEPRDRTDVSIPQTAVTSFGPQSGVVLHYVAFGSSTSPVVLRCKDNDFGTGRIGSIIMIASEVRTP